MDEKLRAINVKIAEQIKKLQIVEEVYLNLSSSKDTLHGNLFLRAEGKTVEDRKAIVKTDPEWINFQEVLNQKEAEFNKEKRWLELLSKVSDHEYGSLKIEASAIRRGVE